MAIFFGRCCWGLGYGPFKEGSALGAIWQRDRTQAQTDVRGGRAKGVGIGIGIGKFLPN